MDIRTAPKKVDDSTGFSFLGVDDNELIKINPNDLIKTTSTYAQIKDDISELETTLESESGNRESAVRAEKEAREAADNTLQTNINAEVTRAESALNTTISNEVTRAKKAESDLSSSIQTNVSSHNTSTTAHDDIRTLINNLTTRINAVADSEDVDLDQLSEIVAYIKSNRSLIDNVTTSKVSVSDIIDNLTSTSANKPLSANQGRVLNTSITSLTTKLNNHIDSLSNVENKSSETIRSEITKKNVIDALGYTPGISSTEPITYTLSKSGSKIILTSSDGTETSVTDSDTNTTYSAGTGITLSGTTFSNAGVRSISSGSTNGTISVNTNGTSAEVAVKGLGSAAYTASSAYAAASHTHNYAGSSSAGGSANSLSYFKNTSTTDVGIDDTSANAIGYVKDTSSILNQSDGAMYRQVYSDLWVHEIYGDYMTGQIAVRCKKSGTWQSWRKVLDSSNYTSYCTPANIGAAATSHTHSYAGSSSAGGSATSAVKLDTSSAGSATQPVYFSGGKPVACTSTFGTTLTSTLSAGSTSLVFSNSVITTSSTIDLYTDAYGVNPTDVKVEAGKMTLTFDAQTKDISVKAVIK